MTKPVRAVSVYYRDEKGVMRVIPNVKVLIIDNRPDKVYTLLDGQELIL